MPGKPLPKIRRAQRHAAALKALAGGAPFCTVVTRISEDWGCSRRQARNVCSKALGEIVGDLEQIDLQPMLAETLHRLQRIADKAEQAGQYAAAVGAVRSLHEFCIAPHQQRRAGSHHV